MDTGKLGFPCIEVTGGGYEKIKKSEFYFCIEYRIKGHLTFMPEYIELIAESKEEAIKWIQAKHPTYIL